MGSMMNFMRQAGLIGGFVVFIASSAAGQGGPTEIFVPGGAFALDNAKSASYRHAGGCLSGQCFSAQGVWLPADRGVIKVGTTFWVPTAWFDQEVEILLYAHSGTFADAEVRIVYSIGNLLANQEFTATVGPEDSGGFPVELITTTLGSTDPVPGGSVLANQQYQGISVGINGDHPENQWSYGILGLLVRLTGN